MTWKRSGPGRAGPAAMAAAVRAHSRSAGREKILGVAIAGLVAVHHPDADPELHRGVRPVDRPILESEVRSHSVLEIHIGVLTAPAERLLQRALDEGLGDAEAREKTDPLARAGGEGPARGQAFLSLVFGFCHAAGVHNPPAAAMHPTRWASLPRPPADLQMRYRSLMPMVHVNGTSLHYLDAGASRSSRDAVVLLHAFPLHSGMWTGQLATLQTRHRVIAPDFRGMGRSGPPPQTLTMQIAAEDLRALLVHLRVERAAVVGLSMGGYIAFELFRQAPGLFRGLALCDTKAAADGQEARAGREKFAELALEKGLGWVAEEMLPKILRPSPDPGGLEGGPPPGGRRNARGCGRLPARYGSAPRLHPHPRNLVVPHPLRRRRARRRDPARRGREDVGRRQGLAGRPGEGRRTPLEPREPG